MSEMTAQSLREHYAAVRKRLTTPHLRVVEIVEREPEPIPVPVAVVPKLDESGPIAKPFRPYIVPREYPTMEDVVVEVSAFYGVSLLELSSARRHSGIVRPRQIAMYLGRTMTPYSFPHIGKAMGGRDHTTCLHGYRAITAAMTTDAGLRDEIQALENNIKERCAARNEALYAMDI